MRTLAILCLATTACGGAASSAWNPKASADLKAMTSTIFTQLDAGEVEAMKASFDDNVSVFDIDPENKPVAAYGTDAAKAYTDTLGAAIKQGLKVKSSVNKIDCQATEVLGFCVVEFDQVFTMGGQTMGPFKFRATAVGRKVNSAWKWTHWHGSFREPPAAAPAAASS